jgi:ElaB/YqjD/DUF883 family membrane-anchored ribosome-binding protein
MANTKGREVDTAGKHKEQTTRTGDHGRSAMTPESSPAGGALQAAREKAQEVAAGASSLLDRAKDTAQDWASSASDVASHAKDKARAAGLSAAEQVVSFEEEVAGYIRRNPAPSLLIGFGLGFLASQLMRRS